MSSRALFIFTFVLWGQFLFSQIMNSSSHYDDSLPNIERNPNYGFVMPVNADILSATNYSPTFSNRYWMSLFGPRYLSTSSSSIGYYDFHQGADITHTVSWNGVNYTPTNKYHIVCNCDGSIYSILDSTDAYLETLGTGRSVKVQCDSSFRNDNWGPIYINYRHLDDLHTLSDSAKSQPQNAVRVHKGDTIGVVGESGITSTVHLHTSIQRYQTGTSTTNFKNVHPYRIYSPLTATHLHQKLEYSTFELLASWTDSALFRLYIPYNQMSVKRLEVINESYSNIFDYEDVSDSTNRDNHALIPGFEVFAYSFNRGSKALSRYNSTKGSMPAAYPASPNRDTINSYFFPITADSTVYILDVKLTNLPSGYQVEDFVLKLSDIYGNVVLGDYGTIWNGVSWSQGPPSLSVNATIASDVNPGSFIARNLTISEGYTLNLDTNSIAISGNISNYGSGISGKGTIQLDKNGTCILRGKPWSYSGIIEILGSTTLQTNELLTIAADSADGYGQLHGDGTITGTVNIEAYLENVDTTNARAFFLGSPHKDAIVGDYNEGHTMISGNCFLCSVTGWNASTSTWDFSPYLDSIAENGVAYSITIGKGNQVTYVRPDPGTVDLRGSPNMTDLLVQLYYNDGQSPSSHQFVVSKSPASTEGWNLIANPFPAIYDWEAQNVPGMSKALYYIDGYKFRSYVNGIGYGSGLLAPFQGYFVQVKDTNGISLLFDADHRVKGPSPALLKRNTLNLDFVELKVTELGQNDSEELFIGFENQASAGFDLEWDAHKIQNPLAVPELYTQIGSEAYSISRVSHSDSIYSYPIYLNYFDNNAAMRFEADLSELQSFTTVYLEDLKTGAYHDLGNSNYLMVHDTAYASPRYYLHFRPQNFSLASSNLPRHWYAFSKDQSLWVDTKMTNAREIRLYHASGKLIKSIHRPEPRERMELRQKGLYIIEVMDDKGSSFQKILH